MYQRSLRDHANRSWPTADVTAEPIGAIPLIARTKPPAKDLEALITLYTKGPVFPGPFCVTSCCGADDESYEATCGASSLTYAYGAS